MSNPARSRLNVAKRISTATDEQKAQGWVWLARVPVVTEEGEYVPDAYWWTGIRKTKRGWFVFIHRDGTDFSKAMSESDTVLWHMASYLDQKMPKDEAILHAFDLYTAAETWNRWYREYRMWQRQFRIKTWQVWARSASGNGWGLGRFPLRGDAEHLADTLRRLHSLEYESYTVDEDHSYVYNLTIEEAKAKGYSVLGHIGDPPSRPAVPNPLYE